MSRKKLWCCVPMCKNTGANSAIEFLVVPKKEHRRKLWFEAARRDPSCASPKTVLHMCEDHFNLEEDLKDYDIFRKFGGYKYLKENVIPHKFECQEEEIKEIIIKRRRIDVSNTELEPCVEIDNMTEIPKIPAPRRHQTSTSSNHLHLVLRL